MTAIPVTIVWVRPLMRFSIVRCSCALRGLPNDFPSKTIKVSAPITSELGCLLATLYAFWCARYFASSRGVFVGSKRSRYALLTTRKETPAFLRRYRRVGEVEARIILFTPCILHRPCYHGATTEYRIKRAAKVSALGPAGNLLGRARCPIRPFGKILFINNLPSGRCLVITMLHLLERYTTESVTSGHPDKVCDQISDAILDACLKQDPRSRVAVETFGSHGTLMIGGEVTTNAKINAEKIARDVYTSIGYTDNLKILNTIQEQSPDIAQGVDTGGAGDQGIMYGYATDETPELMPKAVLEVHRLAEGLEKLRRSGKFPWIKPDGKTQITAANGSTRSVLVSVQHDENIDNASIRNLLIENLIAPIIGDLSGIEILVNPTGKFVQGGFTADTGLTGRKIMVDTYCGLAPHGGGAFSGKDPTKVDRSAAYMARHAAKSIVVSGLAKECLVSVAYAIGKAEPLMLFANTFNENTEIATKLLNEKFDFSPKAIIEYLDLLKPIYFKTAAYGHFGRPEFSWEKIKEL